MFRYIGKRLLQMIPVIFGVITLVFFITALTPGDPAAQILGSSSTEEQRQAARREADILLKAYIARNLFNDEGFYPIYAPMDEILQRALEELRGQ